MMECFQVVLLFVLLVPVPAASPVFIALYLITVLMAVSPCGSCIGWCAILFLATSPSSPFISSAPPRLPVDPEFPLTSPVEDRKWLSWNHGRIWDPTLVGYSHFVDPANNSSDNVVLVDGPASASGEEGGDEGWRDGGLLRKAWRISLRSLDSVRDKFGLAGNTLPHPSESAAEQDRDTERPRDTYTEAPAEVQMPSDYFDLRWAGVGLVLDLGWRRSEQGIEWELAEYRKGAPQREAISGAAAVAAAPPRHTGDQRSGTWIGRMPLLGNW